MSAASTRQPTNADLSQLFFRLMELTHELSNSVGPAMNLLILAGTKDGGVASQRITAATKHCIEARKTLMELMVELRGLRIAVLGPIDADRMEREWLDRSLKSNNNVKVNRGNLP